MKEVKGCDVSVVRTSVLLLPVARLAGSQRVVSSRGAWCGEAEVHAVIHSFDPVLPFKSVSRLTDTIASSLGLGSGVC